MGRSRKSKSATTGYDTDAESSVSELSNGESSAHSRSSGFRLSAFGRKKKGPDANGTASVESATRKDRRSSAPPTTTPRGSPENSSVDAPPWRKEKSVGSATTDQKRILKDAKSRFNIGLVYLKTGDYAKAQENLEHSLFCHIQLAGHDNRAYTNDTIFAISGVREKLGDCYIANTAIVKKYLASDQYEEARRLLKSVDPEDSSEKIKEMLYRVEEKLKQPELVGAGARRRPPSFSRSDGGSLRIGVPASAAASGAEATKAKREPTAKRAKKNIVFNNLEKIDVLGVGKIVQEVDFEKIDVLRVGKGFEKIQEFAHDVAEGIKDIIDDSDDDSSHKSYLAEEADKFETAMAHMERDNHRTAFNYLMSLQEGGSMKRENFRHLMANSMLKVGASALEAKKISVASDAYEEAYAAIQQDRDARDNMKLALKGCIKSRKLLAEEMGGIRDFSSAISHRTRVIELLDEDNRTIPACEQQIKIAYLHGEKEEFEKSSIALSDAIRRLHRGVKSVDDMASDRRDLLITCHEMHAICYAKSKKWKDALGQYDEVLPLIAKKKGQGGKDYNSVLIHKSALLVSMGNHRLAASLVNEYLKLAEPSNPDLNVEDHLLALDTFAATQLKLGNVDKAKDIFEQKLMFVKKRSDSTAVKSDTLHKLGCLLANEGQHESALPLFDEALREKKIDHDGKHKSVLETTWAVAATSHALGDNNKALKEYTALLDKMAYVDGMFVDAAIIHHSAGKLFFDDGKVDKAIQYFRKALHEAETSGNCQLQPGILLNLANALSASGEVDEAMDLYDQLLKTKSLKKNTISFRTRFNKSVLLMKMGEVEEAKEILHKIGGNGSSKADDVRGSVFLTLGNLAASDGDMDEAFGYFEDALDEAEEDDFSAITYAKRSVAIAQLNARQIEGAVSTLEDVLEDLSHSDVEGKSVNLLKAEIWNCMARVYKKKGELAEAKNFSKLALQTYRTELGETNPITLRNKSNLQLLRLEEAESLEKIEAKPIIDAAKYELEEVLEAFVSLDDPWTYRLDVASLQTNLGFVAVWQGKVKKARKLVRQINDIEFPPDHPLLHRIAVLEERLEVLEKNSGITSAAVEDSHQRSNKRSTIQ